jgi:hypothetical protein
MAQVGDRKIYSRLLVLFFTVVLLTLVTFGVMYGCARSEQNAGWQRPMTWARSLPSGLKPAC